MRKPNRVIWILVLMVIILTCLQGCEKSGPEQPRGEAAGSLPSYASFRDIPGVTAEEISDIEALIKQYEVFNFGANPSTEAFYNENGEINGYSALLCEWLSKLFETTFKPTLYEWGELMTGLENGEIHFTGEMTATEERRRKGYFMTSPIAERSVKIMRLADSRPLAEIMESRPLRYAFFDGTTTVDDVTLYANEKFEITLIDDYETAYELLKGDKVDGFVDEGIGEAAFDVYGDVIAEEFFPIIYSPVSLTTQTPELAPVISVMDKALKNGAIRYLTELYNRGHQEYIKHKLDFQLTEEERAYIRNNPVVLVAAEYDNYPVSFYNEYEKEWHGIAFDVLREAERFIGLRFELANGPDKEWAELLQMLEDGEASMVTELIYSEERAGRFLWPKTAILTDYSALLSRADYPNVNFNEILFAKIGLSKGTAHTELFKRWFPNHVNTVEYESPSATMKALENGEVDMVMSCKTQLLSLTNYQELPNYKVNVLFNHSFGSTFGFNKDEAVLCSIVDKTLRLIDTERISGQWTNKTYDYRAKLAQERFPLLVGGAVLSFFIIILLFVLFNRTRREGRKLEHMVSKRTAELESANRAKSDFLSNMSHEIRTPMNAIIGMTSIGMSAADIARTKYCLAKIDDASKHLLGIINDILDMSKIEAGKLELCDAEFNFEKMLQRIVNVVSFRAEERQQKLTVYIDRSIPKNLIGDDQRLAQVITNLLGNAIKFTPERGFIRIGSQFLGEENGVCTIQVSVSDTGIGISEEQQSRLFQSFHQAESSTTRKFGGTGLGLSISKSIVEMMGGEIWIESEIGAGSKFSFTIKVKRGADEKPKTVKSSNTRILVVDGDKSVLSHFKIMAKNFGLVCDTAENREDALKLMKQSKKYHFCFVDHKIQGTDGLKIISAIKESDSGVVAVLMISATKWLSVQTKAKKAGVDKFIPKPLFPSAVVDVVNEKLGKEILQSEDAQSDITGIFKGRSILLAEDVEINREIVLALLEPTKLEIVSAENGMEAVEKFGESPDRYEMIFMDVQMPQMDGYEATRRIRELGTLKARTIPIIAMTANVFKEDIEKCFAAGMNDHIGKPLNLDEVLDKLRAFLT